jgi:hypothetical protein
VRNADIYNEHDDNLWAADYLRITNQKHRNVGRVS